MLDQPVESALERFEKATALPMLLLSLLMIPMLIVPLIWDLPRQADVTLNGLFWVIWALFAFEYATRLSLAEDKVAFLQKNVVDLVVVLLPFFRAVRLVRTIQILTLGFRARRSSSHITWLNRTGGALFIAGTIVLVCAALAFHAERSAKGSNIVSLDDALWWAVVTVTTVGYGDKYPVTAEGRGIATFLMFSGIGITGFLTAVLTSFFLGRSEEEGEILKRLDRIEKALHERGSPEGSLSASGGANTTSSH
jgi:voltage-gated potassium channel